MIPCLCTQPLYSLVLIYQLYKFILGCSNTSTSMVHLNSIVIHIHHILRIREFTTHNPTLTESHKHTWILLRPFCTLLTNQT